MFGSRKLSMMEQSKIKITDSMKTLSVIFIIILFLL